MAKSVVSEVVEETKEPSVVEETKETSAEENKEKMVKIKLPRDKKEPDVFVSVNERSWLIQRGVEVEVPECVAEVLRHREEMEAEAYDFDSSVQH